MKSATTLRELILQTVQQEQTKEIEPYRAIVTAVGSGLVQFRPLETSVAATQDYARIVGFDLAVSDEILVIGRRNPIVIGKIQRAAPTTLTLTSGLSVTGLISGGLPNPAFFLVPGFQATNNSSVTTPTSNQTIAQYLGVAPRDLTSITLRMNVTTGVSGVTWAEVGIATGTPTLGGGANLTRVGFTNVASTFNGTGNINTVVTVAVTAGQHVWALWGSQATTPYVLRGGGVGDALSTGRNQFAAATRISTMGAATAFALTAGPANDAWIAAAW